MLLNLNIFDVFGLFLLKKGYRHWYDDDDDDFVLFQVHLLDNYKDRSPGLHISHL